MNDWTPSEAERRRIFDERILPLVFPGQPPPERPTLLLLAGQLGAGKSRATARLLADHAGEMVPLSGDDLRAFHPHFLELIRSRSIEAPRILAESTAGWLRDCLVHARTSGRSLLLEGTFHSPDVALGTADLFAKHGFVTRVVVVATQRTESLLSAASHYLLDARAGRPSPFASVGVHDDGWEGTRALVSQLEATPSVDRLTIIGRDGVAKFDADRGIGQAFANARATLEREQSLPLSAARSMGWLSELRAMTDFALTSRDVPRPLAELLIELHELALDDVLQRLALPANSEARPVVEASLARQLVTLRRATSPKNRTAVDVAAPVITTPQPGPGLTR